VITWENGTWYKMSLQLYPPRIVDLFVRKTEIVSLYKRIKNCGYKKPVLHLYLLNIKCKRVSDFQHWTRIAEALTVDKTALGEEILFSKHEISSGFNWEMRSLSRAKIHIERLATGETYSFYPHILPQRFSTGVPQVYTKCATKFW
jgi:hypothetical protein